MLVSIAMMRIYTNTTHLGSRKVSAARSQKKSQDKSEKLWSRHPILSMRACILHPMQGVAAGPVHAFVMAQLTLSAAMEVAKMPVIFAYPPHSQDYTNVMETPYKRQTNRLMNTFAGLLELRRKLRTPRRSVFFTSLGGKGVWSCFGLGE